MRRRHQFSIAGLMALVLCTGIGLALLRDPNIRAALIGLAIGGLLFVGLWSIIYICFGSVVVVTRLFRWLRSRAS
jgi:hypothetical protein